MGTTVVEDVVTDFRERDSEALLLWSDRPDFYGRLGFRPLGAELAVELADRQADPSARPYRDEDLDAIVAMHEGKAVRTRRSVDVFRRLLAIPGTETTVLDDGDGAVAYACVGKGLDFVDIVHECGGSDDALLRLLPGMNATWALLPAWRMELAAFLGRVHPRNIALGIAKGELPAELHIEGLDSI